MASGRHTSVEGGDDLSTQLAPVVEPGSFYQGGYSMYQSS